LFFPSRRALLSPRPKSLSGPIQHTISPVASSLSRSPTAGARRSAPPLTSSRPLPCGHAVRRLVPIPFPPLHRACLECSVEHSSCGTASLPFETASTKTPPPFMAVHHREPP
jgi:hypothetical protein